MSLLALLDHVCDIYRLEKPGQKENYGVPIEIPGKYSDAPIATDVPCHFEEVAQDVVQGEPQVTIVQRMRVTFPTGTDVQLNDLVRWHDGENRDDYVEYRLQKPKSVRGHHIIVMALRSDDL